MPARIVHLADMVEVMCCPPSHRQAPYLQREAKEPLSARLPLTKKKPWLSLASRENGIEVYHDCQHLRVGPEVQAAQDGGAPLPISQYFAHHLARVIKVRPYDSLADVLLVPRSGLGKSQRDPLEAKEIPCEWQTSSLTRIASPKWPRTRREMISVALATRGHV